MDAQTFIQTLTDLIKSGASIEQITAAYNTQLEAEYAAWTLAQQNAAADALKAAQDAEQAAIAADADALAEATKRAAYFKRLTPMQIANCGLSNGMPADVVYAKCVAIYPDV